MSTLFSAAYGSYTDAPVYGFDLDGTLICSIRELAMLCPAILERLRGCVNIVIFTNQLKMPKDVPEKLDSFGKTLLAQGINTRIYGAYADDKYRKPQVGMYAQFQADTGRRMEYYVGDMQTDAQYAAACGVPYMHPREYFDIKLTLQKPPQLIMLIGYPASGKSTLARKLAAEYAATVISNDSGGSPQKADAAARGGGVVIIDNLNHTAKARAPYLDIARARALSVTLIYTNISSLEALSRNKGRMQSGGYIPPVAIYSCRKYFTLCSLDELVGLDACAHVLPPFYNAL
jgi:HAD superfamily hydrolase (TIGR01662 family)